MFFARVRWVGRVLDGAGIDTNSKTGRELSTTLIKFSKYCQEKNRRGEGASDVRLDVKGGVNLDHFGGAKVDQLVKG